MELENGDVLRFYKIGSPGDVPFCGICVALTSLDFQL